MLKPSEMSYDEMAEHMVVVDGWKQGEGNEAFFRYKPILFYRHSKTSAVLCISLPQAVLHRQRIPALGQLW